MNQPRTIALIAGEPSGDQLGAALMIALKAKEPGLRFIGLGGPLMEAQGLSSVFPMREIALMGFAEVLPHAARLTRRIREMTAFLRTERPDAIVSIDSPGFVLRVLKKLPRDARIKRIHYVAPTVWAYKPGRAKKFAKFFDYLLCLLPFEPPYFDAVALPNRFVGHEMAWWWREKGDGAAFRAKYNIPAHAPLLAVFPGSRKGELAYLWPVFAATIAQLSVTIPELRVAVQVPPDLVEGLQERTHGWATPPLILGSDTDKKNLFAAATAALAKSGTIGLECALAGLPGVIAYRGNPLSAALVRRLIRVRYVNLANILLDTAIMPELLQEHCTPTAIETELFPLLTDACARDAQRTGLAAIGPMLGTDDSESPSTKAARMVLEVMGRPY